MTATQNTLHRTFMLHPAGGGPTSFLRAVPGRVPQAKTRPPGARLRAPTPGLAPGWGPGDASPGDITTNKAWAQGDFQAASKASRHTLWLSIVSIIFGIITYICAVAALISYLSGKPP
ncbi:hypothetical protein QTP70_014488 [Hemibagrus guttatus]|uniref:Uncharacterized protein n=1 Tax=Hemibagrus guttatus TaxID=175788 RepID=A0AAE0RAL1_9TELE|nr:hypothetical protein QTP70_014488 [Hemibagrus guttatus]